MPSATGQPGFSPVVSPPDDQYLYIETQIAGQGVGQVPQWCLFDQRRDQRFDPDTGELRAIRMGAEKVLRMHLGAWGFWGWRKDITGTAGPCREAFVYPIDRLSFRQDAAISTGVNDNQEYDHRDISVLLRAVTADGTVRIEIDGQSVILAPRDAWEVSASISGAAGTSAGQYQETLRIVNYGWQYQDRIQPARPRIAVTGDGGVTWKVRRLSLGDSGDWGISCPNSSTCYMASRSSKAFLLTLDQGQTWQAHTDLPDWPSRLICPTPTTCYATCVICGGSNRVMVTTDGGARWDVQAIPEELGWPAQISCPQADRCYVAGRGAILSTSDAGHTWQMQSLNIPGASLNGVSCPGAVSCMAVGDVLSGTQHLGLAVRTTDGGQTWQRRELPPSAQALWQIACTDELTCLAAGKQTLLRTTDGGQTWAAPYVGEWPATLADRELTCLTPTRCLLPGFAIQLTEDGGRTWKTVSFWNEDVDAVVDVTCPDARTCFATLDP